MRESAPEPIEDFRMSMLTSDHEASARFAFQYEELKELSFEGGTILYSQGKNGMDIYRGFVAGWKKGEEKARGGDKVWKIQSLSKEEQEKVKAVLKDILKGPIDFW